MKFRTAALIVLLFAGGAGYMVSTEANSFLRIVITEKETSFGSVLPDEPFVPAGSPAPFDAILLPERPPSRLLDLAIEELSSALASRTGYRPVVSHRSANAGERLIVFLDDSLAPDGERFVLGLDGGHITVAAREALGLARGATHLAALFYGGVDEEEIGRIAGVIEPALRYRFVDLGGVGILPDSAAWRRVDYSHHNHALARVLMSEEPFVDSAAMAEVDAQFRAFVDRMAVYGYNGLVMKGFLEFVDFDHVGSGEEVEPAGSPFRVRRAVLRSALAGMLAYAREMGFSVVMSTDMLALSEPLEAYMNAQFGGIDAADPRLWEVYRAGLKELFEELPHVDGLMIRIGEAGTVYNVEGWPYYSSLDVRTVESVRLMLEALAEEAALHGRRLFFRSWSVGVGEVGAMHTSPEMFDRILGGLKAPDLVVSTKFVMGDFYSHLPLNPTLVAGEHPRIVELQARREFEFFASFPNFLGREHQQALQAYRSAGPHIEGLWVWAQEGGPQRRSPISLYPFHGFWQLIDADVYVAAHLGWDPDADIRRLLDGWVRRTLGGEEDVVRAVRTILLDSREPVVKGLYIGPFARRQVRALGLEPPPMMWIFEWDILTASSSVLSAIYLASREELEEAVAEGFEAVALVRHQRERLGEIDPEAVRDEELLGRLTASIEYQIDLLQTLAAYRAAIFTYYRWLDGGGRPAYREWKAARTAFDEARAAHLAVYEDDLDFRALSFFDADAGLAHADRSIFMAWLARLLLLGVLVALAAGAPPVARRLASRIRVNGFRVLWSSVVTPYRHVLDGIETRTDALFAIGMPVLFIGGTMLVTTSFMAPVTVAVVAVSLIALFGGRFIPARSLSTAELLSFTAPMLLTTLLPLAVTAVRGPGYFWFLFWTSDAFRSIVIVVMLSTWAFFFVCQYAAERARGASAVGAGGRLLMMVGLPLVVVGAAASLSGLESALTMLNDELVVLPLGLSRILGITTHLNIPLSLGGYAVIAGGLAGAMGLVMMVFGRRAEIHGRRAVVAAGA
jgi:hypothetical protein